VAKASRTNSSNSSNVLGSGRHTSTECFSSGCDCRPATPASSLKFDDRIPQGTELVIEAGFVLNSSYVTSVVISQVSGSHNWPCMTSNTRNPLKNALGWGAALSCTCDSTETFSSVILKKHSLIQRLYKFSSLLFSSLLTSHYQTIFFITNRPVKALSSIVSHVDLAVHKFDFMFVINRKPNTWQPEECDTQWQKCVFLTEPTRFHRSAGTDIR